MRKIFIASLIGLIAAVCIAANVNIYKTQGGDELYVSSGGTLYIDGGTLAGSSTATQYTTMTVAYTVDVNAADSDCDFQFDNTASNSTAQTIEIGPNTVPAFGQIVSYAIVCSEDISTSGSDEDVLIKLGTSDGGTQLMTVSGANELDVADDLLCTSAGESPEADMSSSAQDIWIEGDPDGVNWDTYSDGQWTVFVTYRDMGSVKTAVE